MNQTQVLLISTDAGTAARAKSIFAEMPDSRNYSLSVCTQYHEAINAMLKSHYHLYLAEHRPGEFNALQLLHEAVRSNCHEPVIVLSAKNDPITDRNALSIGATDYLPLDKLVPCQLEKTLRYSLKRAKSIELLKESENRYRSLFERSTDPIVISDISGRIHDINPAGLRIMGITYEEAMSTDCSFFYRNAEERQQFVQAMEQYGAVADFETEIKGRYGETRHFSMTSFVRISQHGNCELYHTVFRDISHLKQASAAGN